MACSGDGSLGSVIVHDIIREAGARELGRRFSASTVLRSVA
jgi:hypothetical protein